MKNISDSIHNISGQTAIIRCNFDVPISQEEVTDDTRIQDSLETINLLLSKDCRITLISHQGRPEGKPVHEHTLKPIIPVLSEMLNQDVGFADYHSDPDQIKFPDNSPITLVENLRFWPGEEMNDAQFTHIMAKWGQLYINEAFANCHRSHASIVSLPTLIPGYAGVSLAKEVAVLHEVSHRPEKPLVIIIGGAKLETKTPLVESFVNKADHILVGGKIAQEIDEHKEPLPANIIVADLIDNKKDITPESAKEFAQIIDQAGTVIWNGTMGVFEEADYQTGTKIVAQAIDQTSAFTLVGGGDTEAALTQLKLEDNIDFISTGGGAMLSYLSQQTLPGIRVL